MSRTIKVFVALTLLVIVGLPTAFTTLFVGGRLINYFSYGSNFTKTQPNSNAIASYYFPTAETLNYVRNGGRYAPREMYVWLSPDGKCRLENIPDWWQNVDNKGQFISMSGTWKIGKQENWYVIELDGTPFGTWVELVGEQPPYKLSLGVGDPDYGKVMEFETKSAVTQ